MNVQLLGPVELRGADGRPRPIMPRLQCMLAALAMTPRRPVPTETLVGWLWGDEHPHNVRESLYTHASRLRSHVEQAGGVLRRGSGGYVLDIDPDRVDLHRSRRLAAEARAAAAAPSGGERAARLWREACELWRATPLAGLPGDWAARVRDGLDQERLTLLTERFHAELACGAHESVIDPLSAAHTEYPLAEPLAGLLMLALYRSGRLTDALSVYARLRRRLVDAIGTEPGPDLQELHRRMLRRDPGLLADGPAGQRPTVTVSPAQPTVPAQLPADVVAFTGRRDQLRLLDAAAPRPTDPCVVVTIEGAGGVGKTALAVHWAHRARQRFPHGQLYVNLRGHAPDHGLTPLEALGRFLRALGVRPEQVPAELDEAASLYRSILADRRVLVLLDDAAGCEQVRPLIPGSNGSMVLVTSRNRLGGLVALDGAQQVRLDVLTADESRTLLTRVLRAQKVTASASAVDELARLCGHLPLALRIACATVIGRPRQQLEEVVALLRDHGRLEALTVPGEPDSAVLTTFELSYARLPAEAGRMFRMLGVVPVPTVTAGSAAALCGVTVDKAAQLLGTLADAHMVQEEPAGQFAPHDLLREYASYRFRQEEGDPRPARERLYAYYLSHARAAAQLLFPDAVRLPAGPGEAEPLSVFSDAEQALAWLSQELTNLVAAIRHSAKETPGRVTWLLADSLRSYLWMRRHLQEWAAIGEAAQACAQREGDHSGQAAARLSLGDLHLARCRYREAIAHYRAAADHARKAGWEACEAAALTNCSIVDWEQGRLREAAECLDQILTAHRRAGRTAAAACVLARLGVIRRELGLLGQAAGDLSDAVALHRACGSTGGEAHALGNLGELMRDLNRLDEARVNLVNSLALYRRIGDRYGEANALWALAMVDSDAGRHRDAVRHATASVDLAADLGDERTLADALTAAGGIELRVGRVPQAMAHHRQALELASGSGALLQRTRALIGLAAAELRDGSHHRAVDRAGQALQTAQRYGYRLLEGQAYATLAAARLAMGQIPQAWEAAQAALALQRRTGHRLGEVRTAQLLARLRWAAADEASVSVAGVW
ncbi:MAG: BTAD domain-containing putative transcriptional regulator [Micromonosporaceae bacterium]|jgi:DNA-binding SARP family transcriptional activator/tetratricopeptide (TPR) repeat protein